MLYEWETDHFLVIVNRNMITYLIYTVIFLYIFSRVTCGWCYSKVCLLGKTAVITGGNSGIGYQAALSLASRGCRVIIADKDDATETVKTIIRETKNSNVMAKHLDLASFASVRKFAKDIIETEPRLNILINNAGIGVTGLRYTEDELQITLQVNYYGHFLLSHLLLDLLKRSAPSRILFSSSIVAYAAKLSLKHMMSPKNTSFNYGFSKICQTIAAKCFAEKLKGTGVTAYSFHPGAVRTGIFWKAFKEERAIWPLILGMISWIFGKSSDEGAQTLIYLATDQAVEKSTGHIFFDCHSVFYPFQVYDDKFCKDVWDKSKEYAKLAADECERDLTKKLNVVVHFHLEGLDMINYADDSLADCRYNLFAISNHSGTIDSVHYSSYCRHHYSNELHKFNDSVVSPIEPDLLVNREPHALLYEQQ